MLTRPIPSSGELLPAIGLGTWIQFDVGSSDAERGPLRKVLAVMSEKGGTLIDTSPMYGKAEAVTGDLTSEPGAADGFFYATKVWTSGLKEGIDQMETSLRRMRRTTMDLMQVHNLLDWETHLNTLKAWKEAGKVRYTGVTHYKSAAHDQLERVVRTAGIDFVQFNYSIRGREAERSLLDAARDCGVAVIVNEPFDKSALFALTNGKPLPEWAVEWEIRSWGQFFLKYILSHPAVTCVIPGTSDPQHIADNMDAGYGPLPDDATRRKMVRYMEAI